MGTSIKRIRSNSKWFVILSILIIYVVYFLLKINGYMDMSGKYGIKQINCTQKFRNEIFFIDGEKGTVWGEKETHTPGEYIEFVFRKPRNFGQVVISAPEYGRIPVRLIISSDANEWHEIEAVVTEDADSVTYDFKRQEQGRFLRIENMAETEADWPISEVAFYE